MEPCFLAIQAVKRKRYGQEVGRRDISRKDRVVQGTRRGVGVVGEPTRHMFPTVGKPMAKSEEIGGLRIGNSLF